MRVGDGAYSLSADINQTLTFSCKLYCQSEQIRITCANSDSINNVVVNGGIPGKWVDVQATFTITTGKFTIAFQQTTTSSNIVYVDNLSLTIQ